MLLSECRSVIVAGNSGLVGSELTRQLCQQSGLETLHLLCRRIPEQPDPKIICHPHPTLAITDWDESQPAPDYGFICLGTTLKKAGSKEALAKVDFELVCQVANTMKLLGVKRLAVVSSIGADPNSFSHYLRCKGKMEQALQGMGFERLVIVRPGPLGGHRQERRLNEELTAPLLKILSPLMAGKLANYRLIDAEDVAKAMLYALYQQDEAFTSATRILDSRAMWRLIGQYA